MHRQLLRRHLVITEPMSQLVQHQKDGERGRASYGYNCNDLKRLIQSESQSGGAPQALNFV